MWKLLPLESTSVIRFLNLWDPSLTWNWLNFRVCLNLCVVFVSRETLDACILMCSCLRAICESFSDPTVIQSDPTVLSPYSFIHLQQLKDGTPHCINPPSFVCCGCCSSKYKSFIHSFILANNSSVANFTIYTITTYKYIFQ